jgi:site-specific recombinase XerD
MTGCKPLSPSEIAALSTYLSSRDAALFHLGLKTGFRISELLSIRIVDLYEHLELKTELLVARCNMKGKYKSRSVPLSKDTQDLLRTYLSTLPVNQEYLFESGRGQLSRCQAWRAIKSAALKAGLTGKIGTHSLRKSLAYNAYQASGKDLVLTQRILGHSSIQSTISYLQVGNEQVNELWSKL